MNEAGARALTLLQAFETADPPSPAWTEADRAWATRAARDELDGRYPSAGPASGGSSLAARRAPATLQRPPIAPIEAIERRARLALPRLAAREPGVDRRGLPGAWRPGRLVAALLVPLAFGLVADAIGAGQRVDLLGPPLFGVLAWNLLVYLALALAALRRGTPIADAGPIRRRLRSLLGALGGIAAPRDAPPSSRAAWRTFGALWRARSAPLAAARAGAWLHAAAAAFAGGLVAGLYLRGLVLDYRAGWASTFLDAGAVRGLLGAVLGPASALTGIGLPDVAALAALQAPAPGAPAAPWIHLLAGTLALFVILPRLLLAGLDAGLAGWRARRFAIAIPGDPYLERLARELQGGAARVVIVPFAARPDPAALDRVAAGLGAALGTAPHVEVAAQVGYADEAVPALDPAATHVLAWFDLAATPEAEVHGRFLAALAAAAPAGTATLPLVDATGFARRFAHAPLRIEQRRTAWQTFVAHYAGPAVVLDGTGPAEGWEAALRAPVRRPAGG